jgi:hypothetical protein
MIQDKITKYLQGFLFICLVVFMSGCTVIEGIFKAGMLWGIFMLVVIIGIVLWVISRSRK